MRSGNGRGSGTSAGLGREVGEGLALSCTQGTHITHRGKGRGGRERGQREGAEGAEGGGRGKGERGQREGAEGRERGDRGRGQREGAEGRERGGRGRGQREGAEGGGRGRGQREGAEGRGRGGRERGQREGAEGQRGEGADLGLASVPEQRAEDSEPLLASVRLKVSDSVLIVTMTTADIIMYDECVLRVLRQLTCRELGGGAWPGCDQRLLTEAHVLILLLLLLILDTHHTHLHYHHTTLHTHTITTPHITITPSLYHISHLHYHHASTTNHTHTFHHH